jgi:hypothetical protein
MAAITDSLGVWETTLDGLDLPLPQKTSILGCTEHPIRWWKALEHIPDVSIIDSDMDRIKRMMHGSSRSEMRRRINQNIRYREDLRRAGKWKRVISSVLGTMASRRHQPGIDLQQIETDDGTVLGEAQEIHDEVTDQFEQRWFNSKDSFGGSLHEGGDWEESLQNEEDFLVDTEYTGAPDYLRRIIYKAITSVPKRQQIHDEIQDACINPPTLAEFEEAILQAKTNSSAGMSGCSYNQLKRWPPELIRNLHAWAKCGARLHIVFRHEAEPAKTDDRMNPTP